MIESLRIAVADDDKAMCFYYERTIPLIGHQVIAMCENGHSLVAACREDRPDLIVSDIQMPQLDGISAVTEICRNEPLPVILVSARDANQLPKRVLGEHVLTNLIKPIKRADLQRGITLTMQRFRQFQALRQEARDLRQAWRDRKVVEQAKEILMKRGTLDEQAAFGRLQGLASEQNLKLVMTARQLVAAQNVSD